MPLSLHYSRRGFTLVELLAVIAIIGVLSAIVIVAIGSAREKAAASKCASNLRVLVTAHSLYRLDFKGRGPAVSLPDPATDPISEGHNGSGFSLLRRYYREGPRYIWTAGHIYIQEPIEKCPSSTGFDPANDGLGIDYNYGVKDVNFDQFFDTPPKTPIIWDGWWAKGTVTHKVPLRHSGGVNMGYLDGHVERVNGNDGRLYESYMWGLYNSGTPSPASLGSGNALGSTTRPSS